MRIHHLLPLAAAIALGACGQSGSQSGNAAASGGEGGSAKVDTPANAAAVDTAFHIQPGKYRSTVDIQKFEVPDMPAQVAAKMPHQSSFEYCVSPEDAAKGLDAIKKQMANGSCQFESFNASGGKVDSVFTCSSKGGFAMRSVSHGTYTDSGSQVSVTSDASVGGGHKMHIDQTVKAERIGECNK